MSYNDLKKYFLYILMSVVVTPVKRWTINFGKHKGEFFEDLPISYVKWLVQKEVYLKPAKTEHYNKINQHIHNYLLTRIKDSDLILNNLNNTIYDVSNICDVSESSYPYIQLKRN